MKHVNAVVVGAGAGGGVAAKELAEAGLSVLLLERGQWLTPFDCRKDDLRNQRSPYLGNNSGPDDQRHPRVVVDLQGRERTVRPSQGGYQNNAACIGGGTLTYGAMAWRFMEQDFRLKSTYGPLAGSTMEDWPISYMDLEPYYEKAEWEMGVSGDDSANPFKALRRKPLPMPPVRRNRQYEILHPAAVRLGLHPFDIPMLRNSVPYGGRGPCMQCRWCCGFACEVDAKAGTHNTVIPKALATGNCRVETGCMVREILIDQRGRATGVVYFDGRDQRRVQSADVVVVAGGAIETARLLLNSRSRLFPQGLGNRYDWVGRNLQGHSYSGAAGLFDCEVYDDLGPGASVAICDFNHGNPGLIGGAMLAHEFVMLPVWLFDYLPPDIPSWGRAHKEAMQRYHHRTIVVTGPVQEMPVFDARVQLDPKVEDYWGIPVARLSGGRHPHIQDVSRFIIERAHEWLREAGAVRTWVGESPGRGLSADQHQAGTCRMGNDPRTSVVDADCRIHDVPNVFVMDASVHVSNGGFNPVLTILANAYRASERLVKNWRAGGLRG